AVRVWDVTTGKQVHQLKVTDDSILGVTVSPDGKRILTISGDGSIRLWDAATGKETKSEGEIKPRKESHNLKAIDPGQLLQLQKELEKEGADTALAKALANVNVETAEAIQQQVQHARYVERLRMVSNLVEQHRMEEALALLKSLQTNK